MPFDIGGFVYDTTLIRNYTKGGIVTDGLVLHLDAAYANSYPKGGTTWYDLSGNGNHGTLTNGPTYSNTNGGSIVFDGSNDYINGTNNSSLQLTTNLTVGAWVNLGDNANQGIVEKMILSNYNGYGITKQGGYFKFWTASNNTTVYTVSNTTYINDNNWYYVVGRRESGTNRLFINSILQTDSQTPPLADSGGVYVIGRYYSNIDNYYLGGKIAICQIYNRALSAAEIAQNYNATKNRFIFQKVNYVLSSGLSITGNGTDEVTIRRESGTTGWNAHAYSTEAFTAPCTIEFYKYAETSDNGVSYAMIGWNADPTANTSYDTLDWAAYPYRTDNYSVYHNGGQVHFGTAWDSNKKFYIVYDTDGWIRHYNGSTLLYSVNKGTGGTVYVDTSFYINHPYYNAFHSVKVAKASWNGTTYI